MSTYSVDAKFRYARPQSSVVPFSTRKYVRSSGCHNEYCIKAVCDISDIKTNKMVGEVSGYDTTPLIAAGIPATPVFPHWSLA